MKRMFSIISVLVMVAQLAVAQAPVWKEGTLRYGLYMGPIKAGEAELKTRSVNYNGEKAIRMDLIARTTSAADKLFSLNDTLSTTVNRSTGNPMFFQKHCFEGDDIVREKAVFSTNSAGQCVAAMRKDYKDGRVKERTQTSTTPIYDMVSVVGLARNMDINGLKTGQRMNFKLVDAASVINEALIYQGRETVKVSGHKFNCLVFKLVEPYVEKGKSKDREILNIYVADDAERTIVQMDIKFKVGTAKAKIIL